MQTEMKPVVLISAIVGVLAIIGLVIFFSTHHGEEENASGRNSQIMNQMKATGATATAPTGPGAAMSPEAARMRQMGGMSPGGTAPGGMAPGGMAPGGMPQPGR